MTPGIGLPPGEEDRPAWTIAELAVILDHVPGMVSLWDAELRNRVANRAFIGWFGITPEQVRGMHLADLLGPEVFAQNRAYVEAALAGQQQEFERVLVDTSGRSRVVQATYVPRVEHDRAAGFFVLDTDITARVEAETSLRDSRARTALLHDRQRIAADLDAEVVHRLFDAGAELVAVRNVSPSAVAERIQSAVDGVEVAISDLRASIYSLHSPARRDSMRSAVEAVLDEAADTLGFAPTLTAVTPLEQVPPAVAGDLIAVLTEALSNIAKHAGAHHVDVTLTAAGDRISLRVSDDGRGIGRPERSSGLANMLARAERLSGTFRCRPGELRGTVVEWEVPWPPSGAAARDDAAPRAPVEAAPSGRWGEAGEPAPWTAEDLVTVLDNIPAVVTLWDTDLRNRFTNATGVAWFGRENREQVLGVHIEELIAPEVYLANLPYARAALAGAPQSFERTFTDAAGDTRHTQVAYTPNAVGGDVHGMFVLVSDVTARVETQDRLRDSVEQETVLRDRQRIAEDLHDIVIQRLFAASIGLQAAQRDSDPVAAARIETALDSMDDVILALRSSIKDLNSGRHARP